jgi:hypothetical protein
MPQYQWTSDEPSHKITGEPERGETRGVNGEDELTWPMPEQETLTIVSLVVRSDTLPRTACKGKGRAKEELKPTLSTSTRKKKPSTKEAKLKE